MKLRIWVDLPDEAYRSYVNEGRRTGVEVETLVQQTVDGLLRELDREEREGTDHVIIPS